SEQDIDRPFAHDAPLIRGVLHHARRSCADWQLSALPAVPARDKRGRKTIALQPPAPSNIAAETAGKSAELFSRHAAAAGISESLLTTRRRGNRVTGGGRRRYLGEVPRIHVLRVKAENLAGSKPCRPLARGPAGDSAMIQPKRFCTMVHPIEEGGSLV